MGGVDFSHEKHIRTSPAAAKYFVDENIPNNEVTYSEADIKQLNSYSLNSRRLNISRKNQSELEGAGGK